MKRKLIKGIFMNVIQMIIIIIEEISGNVITLQINLSIET